MSQKSVCDRCSRRLLAIVCLTLFAVTLLGSHQCAAQSNEWTVGSKPRPQLPTKGSYDYEFSNISISALQTWLKRIQIEVPVDLDGQLSGWVYAQRSKKSWFDFANYVLEGEFTSPELKIENWTIADAKIRYGYTRGNWYIGSIVGHLRSPNEKLPVGIIDSHARITTATSSNLELTATIEQIDLREFLKSFGLDLDIQNSQGRVDLKGLMPLATANNPKTWKAKASVDLEDLSTPWITSPGSAQAVLQLADGRWQVSKGSLQVAQQDLKIDGTGTLDESLPFQLQVTGQQIDSQSLLRQLKNDALAQQVEGLIGVRAEVVGDAGKLKTAVAKIVSNRISYRSQPVTEVSLVANYENDKFNMAVESAGVADGNLTGGIAFQDVDDLSEGSPSQAKLNFDRIQLAKFMPFAELFGLDSPIEIGGEASGQLTFKTSEVPVEGVRNPDIAGKAQSPVRNWSTQGSLTIDQLAADKTNLGQARVTLTKQLDNEQLKAEIDLQQGNGSIASTIVARLKSEADKQLRLTTLGDFRAQGQLNQYDLVARFDPNNPIPAKLSGKFEINGSPENWLGTGNASLNQALAKIGDRIIRLEMAEISFNESEFRLQRFRLLDPTGTIAGAASLRRDQQGEHLVRLRISDVLIDPYVKNFASRDLASLKGVAGFDIELTKDAKSNDLSQDWEGEFSGQFADLQFRAQSLGNVQMNGNLTGSTISADMSGELFGGSTTGTLRLPLSVLEDLTTVPANTGSQSSPNNSPDEGQAGEETTDVPKQPVGSSLPSTSNRVQFSIDIKKARARRLAALYFDANTAKSFTGTLTMNAAGKGLSAADLEWSGQFKIPALTKDNLSLAKGLTGKLRYQNDRVYVERMSGGFAGGRIDAEGQFGLSPAKANPITNGRINFKAQRMDATSLMAMIYPDYAHYYQGVVDYRGMATFKRGFHLRGSASVKEGSLFGLPIQLGLAEVKTELTPNGGFDQITFTDLHGTAVGGSFDAELLIQGGRRYSLKTSGRVTRGKLEQLSKSLGFDQIGGSGTFNGNFELESKQIESLDAIFGGVRIDFENGDVASIPIVSQLDRFLPLAQFASADIDTGRMNARVGQGQLRISDLFLSSKAFTLVANGRATLDGSRLDLEAVLQTGGNIQQRLTQSAVDKYVAGAIPPLLIASQINEVLRNRSVFLNIGGSASRPVIQPRPGQTAAKAFIQNFNRELTGESKK